MNILGIQIGKKKVVEDNLNVEWGLPDPYLSDYNNALDEIHAKASQTNAFDLYTRPETYQQLIHKVRNAVFGKSIEQDNGMVAFIVARNVRELELAEKKW